MEGKILPNRQLRVNRKGIYLTKKEKKEIDTIIQRGQKVGERVSSIIEKINKEKEENLIFMRNLRMNEFKE